MHTRENRSARLKRFLFLATACLGSTVAAGSGWELDLAVYGWLPNIDVELPSGQKTEITRDDIIDDLEAALMARVRARKDRWSLSTDIIYFDLGNKGRAAVVSGLDLRKVDLEASVIKPSIGYRIFASGDSSTEVYAGARYLYLQPTLRFEQVAPNPSGSFQESESDSRWDGLVGVRGEHVLAARWFIPYYADVGTGDSDSVVDLFMGIGYRFRRFDAVAAWRYLDYDFGNDWVLKTMTVSGPLVGVEFTF